MDEKTSYNATQVCGRLGKASRYRSEVELLKNESKAVKTNAKLTKSGRDK